jgi:ornithine--oxo-acid transaminase
MFAWQYEDGARPDALILGKALGGGVLPISAVASSREAMDVFDPGSHGSTFGGNPLACAVASTALDVIVDEDLPGRASDVGDRFRDALASIRNDRVAEVRGRGLLIGVELVPEAGGARRFCEALMDEGILCKETHENVIRFAPPLVVEWKDVEWALPRIEKVLRMP